MRILKWLGVILAVLLGVGVVGGLLLPDRCIVERDTVIERPADIVFATLDGFTRFNEWSPWRDYDPTARYELEGPEHGVGARMRWQGQRGGGSQEVIALEPLHSIAVRLDFGAEGDALATYLLRPAGNGHTRLIWRFEADADGNLLARWIMLFAKYAVAADFDRGLASLKTLLESAPASPPRLPTSDEGDADGGSGAAATDGPGDDGTTDDSAPPAS